MHTRRPQRFGNSLKNPQTNNPSKPRTVLGELTNDQSQRILQSKNNIKKAGNLSKPALHLQKGNPVDVKHVKRRPLTDYNHNAHQDVPKRMKGTFVAPTTPETNAVRQSLDTVQLSPVVPLQSLFTKESRVQEVDNRYADDPAYAVEYVTEIFDYYREVEAKCVPQLYMQRQPDINRDMRRTLIDWLIEVYFNFKLRPETMFLTVSILDRFLERVRIERCKLQLVGCAAMLIACKYEEIYPPEISDFVFVTKNAYSRDQIIDMEGVVCTALKFRLTFPTVFHFSQRYVIGAMETCALGSILPHELESDNGTVESKSDKIKMETLYFLLLATLDYQCLAYKPSMLSAAALYVAICRLEGVWNQELAEYTGYTAAELEIPAGRIFEQYKRDRAKFKAYYCAESSGTKPSSATRYYYRNRGALLSQARQFL